MATWKQHEALRSVYTVFAGIYNFSTPRPRKWFGTNQTEGNSDYKNLIHNGKV